MTPEQHEPAATRYARLSPDATTAEALAAACQEIDRLVAERDEARHDVEGAMFVKQLTVAALRRAERREADLREALAELVDVWRGSSVLSEDTFGRALNRARAALAAVPAADLTPDHFEGNIAANLAACSCPEAGLDPMCPFHGSTAGAVR